MDSKGAKRGWVFSRSIYLDTRRMGGVLHRHGYTTCIERWDVDDMEDTSIFTSLSACHAWSATPSYFLARYVLGVQILDDGCSKVSIKPNLLGLKYAMGTVPTPKGLIKVRVINGKTEYTVPDGIEVVK